MVWPFGHQFVDKMSYYVHNIHGMCLLQAEMASEELPGNVLSHVKITSSMVECIQIVLKAWLWLI